MKSTNRANPGAACRERSTGRGIRINASGDEDDSAVGSFGKIKDGKNKINVQYIDDMTTAKGRAINKNILLALLMGENEGKRSATTLIIIVSQARQSP